MCAHDCLHNVTHLHRAQFDSVFQDSQNGCHFKQINPQASGRRRTLFLSVTTSLRGSSGHSYTRPVASGSVSLLYHSGNESSGARKLTRGSEVTLVAISSTALPEVVDEVRDECTHT